MDNKTFISRLTAKTGLSQSRAHSLSTALGELIAEHCANLDTVAIPQFGTFTGRKYDETVITTADGSGTLIPPKIIVEFSPGAMLKKAIKK